MHLNKIDIKDVLVDARLTLKETGIESNKNLKTKKDIVLFEILKNEFESINN